MTNPFHSLQRTEAEARFDLLSVDEYDVRLDLASDDRAVPLGHHDDVHVAAAATRSSTSSRTRVNEIRLNGRALDPDLLDRGRLPLETVEGRNELVVDAVMRFRNDGEGLHRSVDPADGRRYVYGMSLHGRRAQHLRLLRPARPQGAVHPARHRAAATGS